MFKVVTMTLKTKTYPVITRHIKCYGATYGVYMYIFSSLSTPVARNREKIKPD